MDSNKITTMLSFILVAMARIDMTLGTSYGGCVLECMQKSLTFSPGCKFSCEDFCTEAVSPPEVALKVKEIPKNKLVMDTLTIIIIINAVVLVIMFMVQEAAIIKHHRRVIMSIIEEEPMQVALDAVCDHCIISRSPYACMRRLAMHIMSIIT